MMSKKHHQNDTTMAFYNKKEQLYLGTDASGIVLGARHQHVRDRMWFPRNQAPDNSTLWPVAFTSKSLTSMETQ